MPHEEENVQKLIRTRASYQSKVTCFKNFLMPLLSCEKLSQLQLLDLETRFKKFDAVYDKFDELQTSIETLSDAPDVMYKYREKFENEYHELLAKARLLLPGDDAGSVASFQDAEPGASSKRNFIRLPKIDLPHFDGSYQCWLEFKDTYLSLIHKNDSLDNISKFHYLRASLQGAAALIIKNVPFNSDSYITAWELLCDRYDNYRSVINNHVKALCHADPITEESSKGLRDIIDITNKNIQALTVLNATLTWDVLIIYMMSTKLDANTCRQWEEYQNKLSELPTLSQFLNFLNIRASVLETIEEKNVTK